MMCSDRLPSDSYMTSRRVLHGVRVTVTIWGVSQLVKRLAAYKAVTERVNQLTHTTTIQISD